jgi:predicted O-linked N-acetylglucosamine transferase (SPINDLY family)
VAYFSADFRNHPISYLTAELFELHDKERFEIIAFSLSGNEKSEMRNRLANSFDQFIDASDKTDLEIALLARTLKIDIAVDLGGYTLNNPLPIFALRAAPIQITYLGYLGTLATPYIDYVIGDNVVIPDTSRQFFSEKIIQLPCFQVNDQKREIAEKKFTRQELGLPNDGFVFCCFNNNYKITPLIFDSWMKILKNVDNSVLFLYAENKWAEENLRQEAEIRFVDKNRLIFGKALPRGEYMSRYLTCDLFLDTFPYNAGTTASDALWMGLPVLTYSGKSFASRMAGSLLSSVGINELITYTLKDYEGLAIYLANNPNELSLIKNKLIQNKKEFPLFNTELFAKNLEKAYESALSKYIRNKTSEHIEIL